ncbi:MAG: S1C family serine protease [Spirochaetota bacterium]
MKTRARVTFCLVLAAAVLLPLAALAQTPSFNTLKKSNVSLDIEGFTFAAGLNPDSSGNANGQGAELLPVRWSGSGFIVDRDGTLITNYHVARKAMRMKAVFDDGASYQINHIKVYDPVNDLAIMQISGSGKFSPVRLGNSDRVGVMDEVLAVGNTLGMGLSVTRGDINQLVKDDSSRQLVRIRHSAPIAPGNSGGALYRSNDVVGVNVATRPPYEIHFAIPINIAKNLLADQYSQAVPMDQVFPPNLEGILQKTNHLWSGNGRVDGASGGQPGVYSVQFELYPLEDYVMTLQSPGADLALGVVDGQGNWHGWSNYPGETEILLLANEYYRPVTVAVFNTNAAPADFGLGIYNILW